MSTELRGLCAGGGPLLAHQPRKAEGNLVAEAPVAVCAEPVNERSHMLPDTRVELWGLAARAGITIASLNTIAERDEALAYFTDMLDREVRAGVQNRLEARAAVAAARTRGES
jgi:hypothetical protein